MLSLHGQTSLGGLRLGVLDGLRLVQNSVAKLGLLEEVGVAAELRVARDPKFLLGVFGEVVFGGQHRSG